MSVSLSNAECAQNVNLRKEAVDSEKDSLTKLTSKVVLALDHAHSMNAEYKSGHIQEFLERIVPLALRFDDDGKLDVWMFSRSGKRLPSVDMDNLYGYVEREVKDIFQTTYSDCSGVIKSIEIEHYRNTPDIPCYVIVVTNGKLINMISLNQMLKLDTGNMMYVQFIGVGKNDYTDVKSLAERFPHVDFMEMEELERLDDRGLYECLLENYRVFIEHQGDKEYLEDRNPDWLTGKRAAIIIAIALILGLCVMYKQIHGLL